MKKFLLAAIAASLVSAPALAAGQRMDRHDQPNAARHDDRGNQYRSWKRGDRFDARHARNYQRLDYRRYHGLRAPPRGYYWARSGDDAVLVAATTGLIASIIANAAR